MILIEPTETRGEQPAPALCDVFDQNAASSRILGVELAIIIPTSAEIDNIELLLAPVFGQNYAWWIAGLAGAAVGAVWNYAVSSVVTWRRA